MPLDHGLFVEHMRDPNLLTMVLKGHLWVESCLNRALELSFEHPDRVEIDRLPFSAKVNLCLAASAIRKDDAPALRLLNKIRNRMAHDLHSSITDADVRALETSLAGALADVYAKVRKEGDAPRRLYIWLYSVLMVTEYNNMVREYERVNAQTLHVYRLVSALQEKLGQPVVDAELRQEYGVPDPPNPRDAWSNYGAEAID